MKSHGSAEELFKHYEAVHNSGIDSTHGGEGHLSPERWNSTHLCMCFCASVELLLVTLKVLFIWTYVVRYLNVHVPFAARVKRQLVTYVVWYWSDSKWKSDTCVYDIKPPVSNSADNAILQTGMIFTMVAEEIQVPASFWHGAEITSFESGSDNPKDIGETQFCP